MIAPALSVRRTVLAALAAAALAAPGAARGAEPPWTAVATGTTGAITAVEYQAADRLWVATATGEVRRRTAAGTFEPGQGIAPGTALSDVAFAPGGPTGVAVGLNGAIWRSTDGGATWAQVTGVTVRKAPCTSTTPDSRPLTDNLSSVAFGDAATVYASGANGVLIRSTDAGATWADANRTGSGQCAIRTDETIGDTAWTSATTGFVSLDSFGQFFSLTYAPDGTATANEHGQSANGFQARHQFAIDRTNPARAWAVTPQPGPSYVVRTTDGGNGWTSIRLAPENQAIDDVAAAGGTVVMAGGAGQIYVSRDGVEFAHRPAGGALATTDWNAVDAYDADHAAVGGANGTLVLADSLATPTEAPVADPKGATAPQTVQTGDATITVFGRVVLTRGRPTVPVRVLSARPPRSVVIRITQGTVRNRRTGRRVPRVVGTARAALTRRARIVRVPVRGVRRGAAQIEIRVLSGGRQVGRRLLRRFIVA